jgi:imidazolonepropionase-like amidohydrolase
MPNTAIKTRTSIPTRTLKFFAALVFLLPCVALGQEKDQAISRILIRAKHIYTTDGIWGEGGEVFISGGKIKYVGPSINIEGPLTVLEVDSLMPGIVDAYSSIGLSGGAAEVSREITPEFDTYSAIDWNSRDFVEALGEGITTAQVIPATESVFSGLACILKTAGEVNERSISISGNAVLAVCSDPTSRNRARSRPDGVYVRQPTNRMGVVWIIRSSFNRIRSGGKVDSADPISSSILREVLDGKRKSLAVSRTDYDIRSALDLGDEFGFQSTIYGGDEVYRIIDEFKKRNGAVVYTALARSASTNRGSEGTALRWNVPGKLIEAGVPFCLAGDSLLDQARFALRFGLTSKQSLAAITLRPSEMLGLSDRIGSIAAEKDADLVAFNGDPLQPTSGISWTMVDGKIYGNDKSKQ